MTINGGRLRCATMSSQASQKSPDPLLPEELYKLLKRAGYKTVEGKEISRESQVPTKLSFSCMYDSLEDEDLSCLPALVRLRKLYLGDCIEITDAALARIKSIKTLEILDLWNCVEITDDGLAHLSTLPKLQGLYLGGAPITDAGLAHLSGGLTKLRGLRLSGLDVRITGVGIAHLSSLPKLRDLDLGNTNITDAALAQLPGGFGNLRRLSLWNCPITDAGLVHLKALDGLLDLDLGLTPITGSGFVHLPSSLRELHLDGCTDVTDDGIAHLSYLRLLRLDLRDCTDVTDDGIVHLKAVDSLEVLELAATRVTDYGITQLSSCGRLRKIGLPDHLR